MTHLFSGLKVLDVASFIAAPAAATILADFGAEVIKVEPPGRGDPYRSLYKMKPNPESPRNYTWQLTNRNKRGITLNLKNARATEVLYKLIRWADVMVINYPPRVREHLKVTYEEVVQANPRIIYADVTGYGDRGPDANKPGFDMTAYWARTGLMDAIRDGDCPPAIPVPGLGDQATAGVLYAAIVTGLYRREKTGQGCHVSAALVAEGIWAAGAWVQAALDGAHFHPSVSRKQPANALVNTYTSSDGHWFLLIAEEARRWEPFTTAIGHPELATDQRFATPELREQNASELMHVLESVFITHPFDHWNTVLEQAHIPFSIIQTAEEVARDQQLYANDFIVPIDDGSQTSSYTIDSPVHIAQEAKARPRVAPELGQHTEEILKEFAYDDRAIAELRADGAI